MTQVIFRIFPSENEVVALFPNVIADSKGNIYSYTHFGQHSIADYDLVMQQTKPAIKEQYTQLYNELVRIGYNDLEIL
jgi:hypothetical protein